VRVAVCVAVCVPVCDSPIEKEREPKGNGSNNNFTGENAREGQLNVLEKIACTREQFLSITRVIVGATFYCRALLITGRALLIAFWAHENNFYQSQE